jgi:hypothetical protein
MLALQRAAGNRSAAALVQALEREDGPSCGPSCGPTCRCHLQRGALLVQRDVDPNDLTGTVFEKFDSKFQQKLGDTGFRGSEKLADVLAGLRNEDINAMARVGAMVTAIDADVWNLVKKIKRKAWVTDNWGIGVEWTDENQVTEHCLKKGSGWCKDSPYNPMHETHNAWRRITVGSGPGLHLILDNAGGTSDIHIDAHQPVKDVDDVGYCVFAKFDTVGHMLEVSAASKGGLVGARQTPVGTYSWLRGYLGSAKGVSADDKKKAEGELDAIASTVTKYAAMGKMEAGSQLSEGDKAMQADSATMAHLDSAMNLLFPPDYYGMGGLGM